MKAQVELSALLLADAPCKCGSHGIHHGLQLGDIFRSRPHAGILDRQSFEGPTEAVDLVKVFGRKASYGGPAGPADDHQSFAIEATQSLANRTTADTQHLGECGFAQLLPGRQPSGQDRVAQTLGNIISQGSA